MSDPAVIGIGSGTPRLGGRGGARAGARLALEYRQARSAAASARELLDEEGDDRSLRGELEAADARLGELDEEIRLAMVERDPTTTRT